MTGSTCASTSPAARTRSTATGCSGSRPSTACRRRRRSASCAPTTPRASWSPIARRWSAWPPRSACPPPRPARCSRATASPPRCATTRRRRPRAASTPSRRSSSTAASPWPARGRPRSCSSCCAAASRSADRDLARQREGRDERDAVAAPEAARVVPARRPPLRQQPHVLVGRRHELGAVDRLERRLAAAVAAREPLAREPEAGREGAAVEAVDRLHEAVLVLARERALEPAGPRALAVALAPGPHDVGEVMQLHAALALARPYVRQRAAELGVPQQRGQVVERDDHADVV